jgi:Calcineurin-like phosphoesterase
LRTTRALVAAILVATVTGAAAGPAGAVPPPKRHAPLTIAVYGDAPYGTSPTDTAEFDQTPQFIASVNADPDVSLVMHVGDIHSGSQYCTEAYDRSIFDLWKSFSDPMVYTPGDNEWTDCHKVKEGGGAYNPSTGQIDYVVDANGNKVDYAGGDPLANLALVRRIFFPHPGVTLGVHRRAVLSQGVLEHDRFVENVIWTQGGFVFVTVNLPGGSNNDTAPWYGAPAESPAQQEEVASRTAADLRWLDTAFSIARRTHAAGVVIGTQADMWDPTATLDQYEPFVHRIASLSTSFGRSVLLINGDSHVYLSDNPLSPSDPLSSLHPGYDVPNFHRIVVHGSTFPLEWLKLTLDPKANGSGANAFGPFSWQREQIPPPAP